MYVIKNPPLQRTALPGIDHATLAGSPHGLHNLSIWRQRLAPGGATPPHRHDCEEVALVDAGSGELRIGGEVHRFEAGCVLVVPRNIPHQILNAGADVLEMTAVFGAAPVLACFPDGQPIELPWTS